LTVDLTGEWGKNNWFITLPSVSLSATDVTSGLAGILYQVDGGTQTIYTSPLTFTREGLYTVQAYAIDYAQHITTQTFQVGYDITPPKTSATLTETDGGMVITFNRWDGVSGFALTRMAINGVWQDYHHPITISEKGEYWVQYFSTDFAGNIEAEKITSFTIAETGVVITQNSPVVDVVPPSNPPNTPPFETSDDFPPNLGDETLFYVSPPVIISTPPDFSDDSRISNNGDGQHTTNTNTTTLSDNPRISRLPVIRENTQTTRLSDVFPLESHTPPQKNPVRIISPMEYVEHPVAFVSTPSTSVVYTTPPQPKPTTSSPLDVTMLAVLGMTMAGAGVMKSQTAIAKQKEQIQADSLAQSQLASAKAQQNATASANWAKNQTMQANAYQQVVGQVVQSEANKSFFDDFINWYNEQIDRTRRLLYILQNTSVTINLIRPNGRASLSLGTIANYNGQQVIVTHDHFSDPPNRHSSLDYIQKNYSRVYIEGSYGNTLISPYDLDVEYRNNGVIFLSLKNGQPFNVTPIAAEIAFNYRPPSDETCYFNYVEGWNRDKTQPIDIFNYSIGVASFNSSSFTNLINTSQVNIIPHSILQIDGSTMGAIPDNPNGLTTILGGGAGRGDSGTGLFNQNGQLIGVFQTRDPRNNSFGEQLPNMAYNYSWFGQTPSESDPVYSNNNFNIIQ